MLSPPCIGLVKLGTILRTDLTGDLKKASNELASETIKAPPVAVSLPEKIIPDTLRAAPQAERVRCSAVWTKAYRPKADAPVLARFLRA